MRGKGDSEDYVEIKKREKRKSRKVRKAKMEKEMWSYVDESRRGKH